jgi:hypothetical protein
MVGCEMRVAIGWLKARRAGRQYGAEMVVHLTNGQVERPLTVRTKMSDNAQ